MKNQKHDSGFRLTSHLMILMFNWLCHWSPDHLQYYNNIIHLRYLIVLFIRILKFPFRWTFFLLTAGRSCCFSIRPRLDANPAPSNIIDAVIEQQPSGFWDQQRLQQDGRRRRRGGWQDVQTHLPLPGCMWGSFFIFMYLLYICVSNDLCLLYCCLITMFIISV